MIFTLAIQFETESKDYVNDIVEDFKQILQDYHQNNKHFINSDIKVKIGGNSSMSEVCRNPISSHW